MNDATATADDREEGDSAQSSSSPDHEAATTAPGATATETTASEPPHVDGLPFLDSTISFVREPLAFGDRVFERGDVVSYDAFGQRFVAISDPDVVEAVLVSRNDEFRKGEFETEFGSLIAADGLAFTEGEQWQRQRHALQGSFTPGKVQGFADVIVDRASEMADDWAATDEVALRNEGSRFALDVLARTLLDVDLDGDRGDVVSTAVDAISEYASPKNLAVPDWIPLPAERRYRRAMSDLDDLVGALVSERRAEASASDSATDATDALDYGDDLLGAMLAAVDDHDAHADAAPDNAHAGDGSAGGICESELRDQLVTFLFAGHETTATALTYVIWLLADHPGARDRLDDELDAVLDGDDPAFEDVPRLEYTEAVVEEALRLYPPVTAIYREAIESTTVGGYRVDPGEVLQLSTYHAHRDDRWWDAPTEFRPERWLDGEGDGETDDGATAADRPEYAFFPFGGGPRHCIGMRFARMELRLALATLANRLEFERVGGFDPRVKITLDPGDVRIRAHRRR